jgi:hypothetical protein
VFLENLIARLSSATKKLTDQERARAHS